MELVAEAQKGGVFDVILGQVSPLHDNAVFGELRRERSLEKLLDIDQGRNRGDVVAEDVLEPLGQLELRVEQVGLALCKVLVDQGCFRLVIAAVLGGTVAVDLTFDSLHTLISSDIEKGKLLTHRQVLEEVVLETHLQGKSEDGD